MTLKSLIVKEDLFHLGIKALILNQKREILLLQVNPKTFKKDAQVYWDIPGGRIQQNSTIEETLLREVEEETGLKNIQQTEFFTAALANIRIPFKERDLGLILFIYLCQIDPNCKIKISSEHQSYGWFEPLRAAELLQIKYPKEFIQKIKDLKC